MDNSALHMTLLRCFFSHSSRVGEVARSGAVGRVGLLAGFPYESSFLFDFSNYHLFLNST
jgi:hypothetical protein